MRRAILGLTLLLAACGGEAPRESPPPALRVVAHESGPSEPTLEELLRDLESDDVEWRAEAADALSKRDDLTSDAVPALARALSDENRWVRDRAARALFRLGPTAAPATPALIEALRDPDGYVRWRAAKALSAIGPAAKEALPALEEMARADVEPGCTWAQTAIRRIRGE